MGDLDVAGAALLQEGAGHPEVLHLPRVLRARERGREREREGEGEGEGERGRGREREREREGEGEGERERESERESERDRDLGVWVSTCAESEPGTRAAYRCRQRRAANRLPVFDPAGSID